MIKKKILLKTTLSIGLLLSSTISNVHCIWAEQKESYTIYPHPQSVCYLEGKTELDEMNIVYEQTIDHYTQEKMKMILDQHDLHYQESQEIDKHKTNILVGTKDSNGYVDQYFDKNITTSQNHLFQQKDAYQLYIKENTIAILGKDSDSAFYGEETLDLILDQVKERKIQNLSIEDYANTYLRGFIEGYYGIPWSHENRQSLMEFGGRFKMNTYIFAPKDDPYHNQKWREFYPEEELHKIKELVETGNKTKTKFTWAIHPFMNDPIDFKNNYDKDIEIVKQKFEQLYSVGVRQFGVCADDISGAFPADQHARVLKDLYAWTQTKDEKTELIFVPTIYNTAFTSWGSGYLNTLTKDLPKDIHIMWTGEKVLGRIEQTTIDTFMNLTNGYQPFFWLNWPVNDINNKRLILSPATVLDKGVKNLDGVVTNPMQQAEASKIALFSIADFAWNTELFDANRAWKDCFQYIEPQASAQYQEIAKHLCDPSNSDQVLPESEEFKGIFEEFQRCLENGESIQKTAELLKEKYEKVMTSVDDFIKLSENKDLKEEIKPWIMSLRDIAAASSQYLDIYIQLENQNDNQLWENYKAASQLQQQSTKYVVHNLTKDDYVEAGTKRLVPFMNQMENDLSVKVYERLYKIEESGEQIFDANMSELMYLVKNPLSFESIVADLQTSDLIYKELKKAYDDYQDILNACEQDLTKDLTCEAIQKDIDEIRKSQKIILSAVRCPSVSSNREPWYGHLDTLTDSNEKTYLWYDEIQESDIMINFDFKTELLFEKMSIFGAKWDPMPEHIHLEYLKDGEWIEAACIDQLAIGENCVTFEKPIQTSQMRIHVKAGENKNAEDMLIAEVSFVKQDLTGEHHEITKQWLNILEEVKDADFTPKSIDKFGYAIDDLMIFETQIDNNTVLKEFLIERVEKAYQELVEKADFSVLENLLKQLNQINQDQYTKESYQNIEKVTQALQEVLKYEYTATKEIEKNVAKNVELAISLLVKKPVDQTENQQPNEKPSVSQKPEIDEPQKPSLNVRPSVSNHEQSSLSHIETGDSTNMLFMGLCTVISLGLGALLLKKKEN